MTKPPKADLSEAKRIAAQMLKTPPQPKGETKPEKKAGELKRPAKPSRK